MAPYSIRNGTVNDASSEPLSDCPVGRRRTDVDRPGDTIHAPVFRGAPRQDDLLAAEGWSSDAIGRSLRTRGGKWSRSGENAFLKNGSPDWRINYARASPGFSPPRSSSPLKPSPVRGRPAPSARWSMSELAAETQRTGLVASISGSTIWRWLHDDAIRPWFHRSWIFPRDPEFATKAGRILDLYERVWEAQPMTADDFVISADEKTSMASAPPPPRAGAVMKVEHEYERAGAWAYLAALDVQQARLFGRCEPTTGIRAKSHRVKVHLNGRASD